MLGHKIIVQIILRLINAFFGFVSSVFIAKYFLPEAIGEVFFITGLCSIGIIFFDFGINKTASTKIAQGKFTPEDNLVALIYFKLLLSFVYFSIVISLFFVNIDKIKAIGISVFLIIVLALYFDGLTTALQNYFIGKKYFYKYMIGNFLAQITTSLLLIFVSVYHPTKLYYVFAILARSLMLGAVIIYQLKNIKFKWTARKEILKDYLIYVKPLIFLTPVLYLIGNAEQILLPHLVIDLAALGIFAFGLKFYGLLNLIKKTFSEYFYIHTCHVISAFNGVDLFDRLNNMIIMNQVAATVLVVGVINRAGFLISLFFGSQYIEATIVTQLMCFLLYLDMSSSSYFHVIDAKAMHGKMVKWHVVGGVLLLVLSVVLIPGKLIGLTYAGLPLARLVKFFIPTFFVVIFLVKKIIGKTFVFTQVKFFIFFLTYLLFDYLILSFGKNEFLWVIFSWFVNVIIYLTIIIKFFINKKIKNQISNLFNIKYFKQGLAELDNY